MNKKMLFVLPLAAAMLTGYGDGKCCKIAGRSDQRAIDPVIGNWSAKLPYDSMVAGSLIFSRDEDGNPKAFVLLRWASPEWCSDVKVEGNTFSLRHPYGQLIRGKVCGDKLFAEIAPCDKKTGALTGAWQPFGGWRNLPVCGGVKTSDAKLGELRQPSNFSQAPVGFPVFLSHGAISAKSLSSQTLPRISCP